MCKSKLFKMLLYAIFFLRSISVTMVARLMINLRKSTYYNGITTSQEVGAGLVSANTWVPAVITDATSTLEVGTRGL